MFSQKKKNLGIFCIPGLETFIKPIIPALSEEFNVKLVLDGHKIQETIFWSDYIWLEWGNESAIEITRNLPLKDKKVVCRIHAYEIITGMIKNLNLEKIDTFIFVGEHMKQLGCQLIPVQENSVVIPNGVNLDKSVFKERGKGDNIAFVAHINNKKGPMLLLHAFKELLNTGSYKLHIAGDFQDDRYVLYFKDFIKKNRLEDKIILHGWVDDIDAWYEDKNYLICTSPSESQGMGIMEAMAKGIKPLIHSFVGAEYVYPEKYLWKDISELTLNINGDYNSQEYRKFIEENYNLKNTNHQIIKLLKEME